MGYYTIYELDIVNGDENLIEALRDYREDARYAITGNGEAWYSSQWYGHEKDLRSFSLLHPDALFKLSGKGEESGDLWIKYYKNGKMQSCKAKIVFDEFNADYLQ